MIAASTVPTLSVVFMAVSAFVSIGLPIGLFIYFKIKLHISAIPMLVGATSFVVAVLILESIMHTLVLKPDASGEVALRSNPLMYMLYGGFAAGIFEETARFICFKFLRKKHSGVGTGISYGIGHGGIESILLAGLAMLSNILMCFITPAADSSTQAQVTELITTLANTESYLFLFSGFERIVAITIQISLSVIVWYSVNKKELLYLYPAAIVIHAVIDFPAALSQAGVINNLMIVEALAFIMAGVTLFIAFEIHKRNKNTLNEVIS